MNKINWKVRFNKKNIAFLIRFLVALGIPVLTYLGLKAEDLTTWQTIGNVLVQFVSNPFLIGLTVVNAFNMVPDPTTQGLGDSERAMAYTEPK
ncbi:phage holin [Aerococcaceae bacterium NML190938]|nr:phage holin [Aerococcaceae bacterium NML190938]